ncbi:hypothetical protein [Propylenella binzhouense]|uniref:Chaperone protein DnaJ n=1 Tax=Propylenella binzhouense TaxID=2555902 RepID=A0A964T4W1_9HYPH|nr:hypothetical protein [Propylenella binzhouense]MYZ48563.1 hypothetical protein [Propylenella binzhouense]
MSSGEKDPTKAQAAVETGANPGANPGDEAAPGTPGSGENICPVCGGTGRLDGRKCQSCGGTGRVIEGIGGG